MQLPPTDPETDLRVEIAALRAEISALRSQVDCAAQAPQDAMDRAFGNHSILGLRWFGTLMYVLLYPLYWVVSGVRALARPKRRYSAWENFYAASFTWVYLAGKEDRRLARLTQFFPNFRRIREQLRQE